MHNHAYLDEWSKSILANPITKLPCSLGDFKFSDGVMDARVFLPNTHGFHDWFSGQTAYEAWETSSQWYKNKVAAYQKEIDGDRPTYQHFKMAGNILDIGGGAGTVREFLSDDINFISIDPFLTVVNSTPAPKREAYRCLSKKLNFICGLAEFLPFKNESFDWAHMRSMLDHVQVPDLALLEAYRVLKPGGKLLVGLYVEGGKTGRKSFVRLAKDIIKHTLGMLGFDKWKDHHTWHPSFKNLQKLITDNQFVIEDIYWQPGWNDTVVYIQAKKA